jgi:hypothetical protein
MRFAWLAASLVFLAGAFFAVFHELRLGPLTGLAEAVDASESLPETSPELQKRIEAEIERSYGCDRRLARSRVAASLFLLRKSIADGSSIDERTTRFTNAKKVVGRALACRPLDGALWFMAAKLNWIAAFEQAKFRDLVHMSISAQPYEGEAVHARWRFMAAHLKQTGMADDSRLIEDLETELRLDNVQEANWVAQTLKESGEGPLVDRIVALLPPERQQALTYAADPTRPRPDRLSKYRQFKIAPFGGESDGPAPDAQND